ncbi:MAG: hypothetical protein COX19_03945 [Desulfobacterales bacterium CG23_combo_of_CG06-09_8_20_14_all_51_8]|nr:MAG: hypothetical protein COX19_03945 [Desulfobacterales bacterium CG23_combo_of_CG06-09_8_20_14_all_51_8]
MYERRKYRDWISPAGLVSFGVTVRETDLWICAERPIKNEAQVHVFKIRGYIESYIRDYPGFLKVLAPWVIEGPVPEIVREMAEAGVRAGVGPMAAVAGAVAESVGRELLRFSGEIIVENGGDIFMQLNRPFTYAVFAGKSPLSMRFGIRIDSPGAPIAVCTSSATIGHSYSAGKADAVCVVSHSGAIADAAATAICNHVSSEKAIQAAIDFGRRIDGVDGMVIIAGEKAGFWGNAQIVPLGVPT